MWVSLGMVGDFSASHSRIIDKTCFMGGVRWLLSHYAHNKHGGRGKTGPFFRGKLKIENENE